VGRGLKQATSRGWDREVAGALLGRPRSDAVYVEETGVKGQLLDYRLGERRSSPEGGGRGGAFFHSPSRPRDRRILIGVSFSHIASHPNRAITRFAAGSKGGIVAPGGDGAKRPHQRISLIRGVKSSDLRASAHSLRRALNTESARNQSESAADMQIPCFVTQDK
jgi:hypothetical protein